MASKDPRNRGASRYYGETQNPRCVRCEYRSHPVGKTTKDGPVCTHCVDQED